MPLPNLVLAGPPKCGTSSCFYWLCEHPEVCGSSVKEPWYLIDRDTKFYSLRPYNYYNHGIEGYKQFFSHCKNSKVIVEATTEYIYLKTPVQVLSNLEPKPHILFILREPANRLFSFFRFNKYRMKKLNHVKNFQVYIEQLRDREARGEITPLKKCIYVHFLNQWAKVFPLTHLHLLLFEDMKSDPKAFMELVSKTLDIDVRFWANFNFDHRNPTVRIHSKWVHRVAKKIQSVVPHVLQKQIFLPLYFTLNASPLPPVTQNDKQVIEDLRNYFRPYNQQLAQQFKLDLSGWE